MKRIREIKVLNSNKLTGDFEEIEVDYQDGTSKIETYKVVDNIDIDINGISVQNTITKTLGLPTREVLSRTEKITFENCIFIEDCSWNFYEFNSCVLFINCIFVKNFILFGDFNDTVSFEKSTFLGNKSSFQECRFEHFNFNLVTLNNCFVDFQETSFYSNNLFFGNMSINNSQMLFNNSFFPKDAELLELLGTETDMESKILFRMVDFKFNEIRLFKANISRLEFIDCTFECNRFDFDFLCDTLIMQDCKNFRILTLHGLENLKNLNIYNFVNTGRVLIHNEPEYYIAALMSTKKVIWKRGNEYVIPEYTVLRNELFALMSFFDPSQRDYAKKVGSQITIIEKAERERAHSQGYLGDMKIFLSYSWSDEALANDIDDRFAQHQITLVRDKRGIKYKNSIKEFMKQIREGDYALIIISDNYLKSASCMYEITEFIKDENYKERILPILKTDANIFKSIDRNKYIRYWQNEYLKLKEESSDIEESNKIDSIKEMIRYEKIQRELPDFMSNIADMDLIICNDNITDEDFEKIKVLLFEQI